MAARTITGTIAGRPRALIRFRQQAAFVTDDATYLAVPYTATADANGDFTIALPVPDSGTVLYRIELPDGTAADVNLADGAPTTLETLLAIAGSSVPQSAIQTAIDIEAAARDAADDLLQAAIDAEAVTRAAADTTLSGQLTTEAATRASADTTNATAISTHTARTDNPHATTAAQVGAYTTAQADTLLLAKVPTSRQLTINGTAFDLSADRSWTVTAGQGMKQTTADSTGATDAATQLNADITTAVAAGHRRLYLPAGTYKLTATGGTLFSSSADNLEIFGDGIGKTIIQIPAATALTSALTIFQLTGKNQWLHDFSIQIGAGLSGAFDLTGIAVYQGAYYTRLNRIEISGVYGSGTAGGGGITTYQPYNQAEVSATLGTAIAAGARTVTPPSMVGIYAGRTLTIGGSTETIQVTSITETTFTATFANAHGSSDSVSGTSNARQYALIEDCIVRDSYKATGFVINSAANTLRRCQVLHVGSSSQQHGFYVQAAQNDFIDCRVEGASGFSYHQHIATAITDASGNRYIGCESINPGSQHLIADGSASDGTNPDVPNTAQLARYTVVANCLFRRTKGAAACSGVRLDNGGIIQGCMFDDATGAAATAWVFGASAGTGTLLVTGNVFRVMNTGNNSVGIIAYATSVIIGNQFINWSGSAAIRVDGACRMQGNQITMTGNTGIRFNAGSAVANDNLIIATGGNAIEINNPSLSLIECRNNVITCSGGAKAFDFQAASFMPTSGMFAGNRWTGGQCNYYDAPAALIWRDNAGSMNFRGNATALTLDAASGRLRAFPKSTNTLTSGLLVKIASGALLTILTSDTVFYGVATSTTDATSASAYIVGDPGSECTIAADAAWAAGNIGIASTTSAGKIHDSGLTTAPASGSYVLFLDTGGAAGNARCLIVKTL